MIHTATGVASCGYNGRLFRWAWSCMCLTPYRSNIFVPRFDLNQPIHPPSLSPPHALKAGLERDTRRGATIASPSRPTQRPPRVVANVRLVYCVYTETRVGHTSQFFFRESVRGVLKRVVEPLASVSLTIFVNKQRRALLLTLAAGSCLAG